MNKQEKIILPKKATNLARYRSGNNVVKPTKIIM